MIRQYRILKKFMKTFFTRKALARYCYLFMTRLIIILLTIPSHLSPCRKGLFFWAQWTQQLFHHGCLASACCREHAARCTIHNLFKKDFFITGEIVDCTTFPETGSLFCSNACFPWLRFLRLSPQTCNLLKT